MSVDLGARFLHSEDPQFANGERIDFTTLEPSISINLFSKWPSRDFLDYGFGAGVYWFSSTEFPSFNGAFIEPLRFEFHTTTAMKQKSWASLVPSVRVSWLNFPGWLRDGRSGPRRRAFRPGSAATGCSISESFSTSNRCSERD